MRRDEVQRRLTARRAELQRFGVKSLSLFGSVARDEAKPGSDIDILVEFTGPVTFDNYTGLLLFLEGILEGKVDLATPRMVRRPRLRRNIDRDLVHVA
jgi:predicted nucleotidyltransferase